MRMYYAGYCNVGVINSGISDSTNWTVHAFTNRKERDTYVEKNRYQNSVIVTVPIDYNRARKIVGAQALRNAHDLIQPLLNIDYNKRIIAHYDFYVASY